MAEQEQESRRAEASEIEVEYKMEQEAGESDVPEREKDVEPEVTKMEEEVEVVQGTTSEALEANEAKKEEHDLPQGMPLFIDSTHCPRLIGWDDWKGAVLRNSAIFMKECCLKSGDPQQPIGKRLDAWHCTLSHSPHDAESWEEVEKAARQMWEQKSTWGLRLRFFHEPSSCYALDLIHKSSVPGESFTSQEMDLLVDEGIRRQCLHQFKFIILKRYGSKLLAARIKQKWIRRITKARRATPSRSGVRNRPRKVGPTVLFAALSTLCQWLKSRQEKR